MYPAIDLNKVIGLTDEERALAAGIINKQTGCLRASKPKVTFRRTGKYDQFGNAEVDADLITEGGDTAYIWRMVAFFTSSNRQHQCMPCTADFDLNGNTAERMARAKYLDTIVDRIVDSIPKNEWHGVRRWAHAFGY
jgi:hypothetical protein